MKKDQLNNSVEVLNAYESEDLLDHLTAGAVLYSKENIPIGHLTSHLETITSSDTHPEQRTAPPTPLPHYLGSPDMRAMSEASLFIPDSTPSQLGDELPLILTLSNSVAARSWEDRGAAKIIKTLIDLNGNTVTSIIRKSVKDFKFGKTLGEGSYSTVVLATDKSSGKNYAIKVLDKRHIIREKKVKYVNIEKNTLNRLGKRNGIIHLYFTFQDEASLYFVLDYAPNGELLTLIKKHGTMNEESVKYYCAQVLDGIKYMHDNGVVHRDMKPENILIDSRMRAQITDFGTAKLLEENEDGVYPADVKANSFVGTAEYVSPELLNDKYCGKPCDIWAFGCIMYQMVAGKPPFKATNEYLTFQKVCKLQYAFTAGFPLILRDLIKKILVLNPNNRATVKNIQDHYFFADVDWDDHDSLFEIDPPELGPYKVTAKSMMPVPELSQQSLKKPKRPQSLQTQQNSASSLQPLTTPGSKSNTAPSTPKIGYEPSSNGQLSSSSTPSTPYNASPQVKNSVKTAKNTRSASSAAAAALQRNVSDSVLGSSNGAEIDKNGSPLNQPRRGGGGEQDLYIPGTNILRPVVKTRIQSKSSTNNGKSNSASRVSSNSKSSSRRSSTKTIAVTPMTQIDLAWAQYLKHPDERILKVGHVLISQTTTDQFEKKFKGMLAESPLGYTNGKRSNNSSQSSLLSQIANGQHPGLRRGNSENMLGYIATITENEKDTAILYDYDEEVSEKLKEKEKEKPEKGKFKKVFGGFGGTHNSNSHNNGNVQKDRTLLITSFGRALIFKLNKDVYELRTEIDLTNPAVKFKEIVGDRRVKNLRTTGIFAIESLKLTLMFEVDKQDIIIWTTCLAKSKENQEERILRDVIVSDMGSVTNVSNALTAAAIASITSPKSEAQKGHDNEIADMQLTSTDLAAVTEQIKNYDLKTLNKLVNAARSPRGSLEYKRSKESSHQQSKLMDSKLKRKPPPKVKSPVPQEYKRSEKDDNLIAAAINTAIRNPDLKPTSNNRSSSFSRGGGSYFYSKSESPSNAEPPSSSGSQANGKNKVITSLNSRFLARSHRKK